MRATHNLSLPVVRFRSTSSRASVAFQFQQSESTADVKVESTAEQHNITVDNPPTTSMKEEKIESVSSEELKNYPFERDCGLFVASYAENLSDGLQVPNYGLDVGLLHKRYDALFWKYGEVKAQKLYLSGSNGCRSWRLTGGGFRQTKQNKRGEIHWRFDGGRSSFAEAPAVIAVKRRAEEREDGD
ncbi:hypothetical protein FXO38_22467 [Capsicum annuum]|nr:hypothetical protein FXO37_29287 [Capsicum annuum]KAF3639790.1 hypothetical protein FXO38_22467 [Capsicum annuum]